MIIKRGGHEDQLSKAPGLDKFRIQALKKVIDSGQLEQGSYQAAVRTLQEKCTIFAGGCRKRGKDTEAQYYEKLAEMYT
jgi:ribosomal protein L30E